MLPAVELMVQEYWAHVWVLNVPLPASDQVVPPLTEVWTLNVESADSALSARYQKETDPSPFITGETMQLPATSSFKRTETDPPCVSESLYAATTYQLPVVRAKVPVA